MFGKKKNSPVPRARHSAGSTPVAQRNAAVFSYYANSRPSSTPAGAKKGGATTAPQNAATLRPKPRVWLGPKGRNFLTLVLVGVALLANLYVSSTPAIKVTDGGVLLRDAAVYRQAAQQLLRQSAFNHSKLTLRQSSMRTDLLRQFPELENVSLTAPIIGSTPQVVLQPAVASLMMTTKEGATYVISTSGRVLAQVGSDVPVPQIARLHLSTVTDQSGLQVHTGQASLPQNTVYFISEVVGQLKANKLQIVSLTLPPSTSELDVRVQGTSYFVKFAIYGDARVEAGTFIAAKQQLERTHAAVMSYIDVRVDGRAYYN